MYEESCAKQCLLVPQASITMSLSLATLKKEVFEERESFEVLYLNLRSTLILMMGRLLTNEKKMN